MEKGWWVFFIYETPFLSGKGDCRGLKICPWLSVTLLRHLLNFSQQCKGVGRVWLYKGNNIGVLEEGDGEKIAVTIPKDLWLFTAPCRQPANTTTVLFRILPAIAKKERKPTSNLPPPLACWLLNYLEWLGGRMVGLTRFGPLLGSAWRLSLRCKVCPITARGYLAAARKMYSDAQKWRDIVS